ncbi:MAG: hypothetical protein D6675_01740 [Gemmatimonadetes bacterium]|nr:MAG: hypothetical protein D6675_01740 [Gemmatimonadota bacterium]
MKPQIAISLVAMGLMLLVKIPTAGSIDLNYSFYNNVQYSLFEASERDSLVERAEVNLQIGLLRTGMLLEARQPLPKVGDAEQGFGPVNVRKLFFELEKDGFSLRAGDFPVLFGRGLSINLFRDDALRQDTEPEGIKLGYRNDYVQATAFSGYVEKFVGPVSTNDVSYEVDDTRQHLFRGAASTFRPFTNTDSPLQPLELGVQYVRFRSIEAYPFPQETRRYEDRRTMTGGSLFYSGDFFDIYGEYVTGKRIENELYPDGKAKFTIAEYDTIQGIYGVINAFWGDFSLFGEFKDYQGLGFFDASGNYSKPIGQLQSPAKPYNNPPPVVTEHTSRLLGRDMYQPIILNNERGYRVELEWTPTYSTQILVDYTRAESREGDLYFQEYYLEFEHSIWDDNLSFMGMIEQGDVGEKADRTGGWLKTTYQLNDKQSIALTTEYMDGTVKNVADEVGQYYVFSFSQSKDTHENDSFWRALLKRSWTLSAAYELSSEADQDGKDNWFSLAMDYKVSDNHLVRLFYGARRAGLNCNGAICVPEPAFEGFECQLISVF